MEAILAILIALGLGFASRKCCNQNNMESDDTFIELSRDLHGKGRWKQVNKLHNKYGIDRKEILSQAKAFHK